MNNASFNRGAGWSALAIALFSLLYAIFFLILTPADQRGSDTAAFFSSFAANSGPYLTSWWLLLVSGLLSTLVIVAIYGRVRQGGESWALWATILGVATSLLSATHAAWEVARLPGASDLYAQHAGDAAYAAAFTVNGLTPSQLDPRGFASFGVLGIWFIVAGMLALRGGTLPRPASYLALAQGILVIALYFSTLLGQGTLLLITGGLAAVIVGPAFWIITGMSLLRAEQARSVETQSAPAGSGI